MYHLKILLSLNVAQLRLLERIDHRRPIMYLFACYMSMCKLQCVCIMFDIFWPLHAMNHEIKLACAIFILISASRARCLG